MTERERIALYNDLCDFKEELSLIRLPPQTKKINTLSRAIEYVYGTTAKWQKTPDTCEEFVGERLVALTQMQCSACRFAHRRTDFKYCPNCGTKIAK